LGALAHPLIADFNKKIARDYQCLEENLGFALRATFIIDPDGDIVHADCNITRIGRSVDEVLRLLQAAQTGDQTPVGWKVGSKTWARDSRSGRTASKEGRTFVSITPKARPNVEKMSGYTPGEQPRPGERVVKLNTNENPFPLARAWSKPSATSIQNDCGATQAPAQKISAKPRRGCTGFRPT